MVAVWTKGGETLEVAAVKVFRKREVRRQAVPPSVVVDLGPS